MSKLKPDRSTPAFPTVTEDPEELVTTVRTIVDALNIRDRRTRDIQSSFVTVKDLVDVGLITYDGQNAKVADALTTTGSGGGGSVTFANPTALVGPTAINGVATTAMRSDAAPAFNTSANYDVTGIWRFDNSYFNVRHNIGGGSYRNLQLGWTTGPEVSFQTFTAAGANYGFYLAGTKYFSIATTGVSVPIGPLSVAGTSVRDGAILTSGTVDAARLPTFGSAAAGIVPASGGGTTNFLRADGTWAAPPTGGVTDGDKGDITVATGGTVWTIDATVVTNAKLANVATATFKGRTTAGTGSPEDLTGTQATALLDTFTSTLKGLAPSSGGGTTNFLRADGTWAVPPGTSGVTFANPTATVGPTAVNGTAVTAMRSDAAPAINTSANYTMTGTWTFRNAGTGSIVSIDASSTNWQATLGFNGTSEFAINSISFLGGAPSIGLYVGGNRYVSVTAGNVDIQNSATLTVASTSVRDGAILTSGTVNAARLPTFGAAAAGIVPASGGGTTNFLRADGTWAGAAASGANTDITALDQDVTVTATGTIAANTIGYRGLPQSAKTASYTLASGDQGKHISITTGGISIPVSVFAAGEAVTIFNNSGSTQTVTPNAGVTLRMAGTANTGTRNLALYGLCTILCVDGGATPTFVISGAGVS